MQLALHEPKHSAADHAAPGSIHICCGSLTGPAYPCYLAHTYQPPPNTPTHRVQQARHPLHPHQTTPPPNPTDARLPCPPNPLTVRTKPLCLGGGCTARVCRIGRRDTPAAAHAQWCRVSTRCVCVYCSPKKRTPSTLHLCRVGGAGHSPSHSTKGGTTSCCRHNHPGGFTAVPE
jgi:hypothetical protein